MIPGDAAQEALRPADLIGRTEEGRRGFDSRAQASEAGAEEAKLKRLKDIRQLGDILAQYEKVWRGDGIPGLVPSKRGSAEAYGNWGSRFDLHLGRVGRSETHLRDWYLSLWVERNIFGEWHAFDNVRNLSGRNDNVNRGRADLDPVFKKHSMLVRVGQTIDDPQGVIFEGLAMERLGVPDFLQADRDAVEPAAGNSMILVADFRFIGNAVVKDWELVALPKGSVGAGVNESGHDVVERRAQVVDHVADNRAKAMVGDLVGRGEERVEPACIMVELARDGVRFSLVGDSGDLCLKRLMVYKRAGDLRF